MVVGRPMTSAHNARKRPRYAKKDTVSAGACRPVSSFTMQHKIGCGAFGTVFLATDNSTGRKVALKQVTLHNEAQNGFPRTSIREISILRKIQHQNIVQFHGVVVGESRTSTYLSFEYCQHDMAGLLAAMGRPFTVSEAKGAILQILDAVNHLHDRFILHRDLKLSNLLYTSFGKIKLADFGLARQFASPLPWSWSKDFTPNVVTLWYRAPELLLGLEDYGTGIDMWAIGCIFAELLIGEPLLPGKSELNELDLIAFALGPLSPNRWLDLPQSKRQQLALHRVALKNSGLAALPDWVDTTLWRRYQEMISEERSEAQGKRISVQSNIKDSELEYRTVQNDNKETIISILARKRMSLTPDGVKFLLSVLQLTPDDRVSSQAAIKHVFFHEQPMPAQLLPTFPSRHGKY